MLRILSALVLFIVALRTEAVVDPCHTHEPVDLQASWRLWDGSSTFPSDAMIGGEENGENLFVCRYPFSGGVHVGKVYGRRNCNFGYGGVGFSKPPPFEILIGKSEEIFWLSLNSLTAPSGCMFIDGKKCVAFEGGHEADGTPRPVCRAYHGAFLSGSKHPGKYIHESYRCNYEYGGKELEEGNAQILLTHGIRIRPNTANHDCP